MSDALKRIIDKFESLGYQDQASGIMITLSLAKELQAQALKRDRRIEELETDHAAYVAKHSYHNEIVRGYQQRIANLEARADLADKWEVTDSE